MALMANVLNHELQKHTPRCVLCGHYVDRLSVRFSEARHEIDIIAECHGCTYLMSIAEMAFVGVHIEEIAVNVVRSLELRIASENGIADPGSCVQGACVPCPSCLTLSVEKRHHCSMCLGSRKLRIQSANYNIENIVDRRTTVTLVSVLEGEEIKLNPTSPKPKVEKFSPSPRFASGRK